LIKEGAEEKVLEVSHLLVDVEASQVLAVVTEEDDHLSVDEIVEENDQQRLLKLCVTTVIRAVKSHFAQQAESLFTVTTVSQRTEILTADHHSTQGKVLHTLHEMIDQNVVTQSLHFHQPQQAVIMKE
jgi:uncharacterized protein with PIN domain